jgi:hypothetical protein
MIDNHQWMKELIELHRRQRPGYVEQFIEELAIKTGRTQEDLLMRGLLATDFKGDVIVKLEDSSEMKFNYAFYVENSDLVAIFTEHYGYHAFFKDEILDIFQQ